MGHISNGWHINVHNTNKYVQQALINCTFGICRFEHYRVLNPSEEGPSRHTKDGPSLGPEGFLRPRECDYANQVKTRIHVLLPISGILRNENPQKALWTLAPVVLAGFTWLLSFACSGHSEASVGLRNRPGPDQIPVGFGGWRPTNLNIFHSSEHIQYNLRRIQSNHEILVTFHQQQLADNPIQGAIPAWAGAGRLACLRHIQH